MGSSGKAYWLGLPALVLMPLIVISGLMQVVYSSWTLQITGALMALVYTTIGAGLLGLLVMSITQKRLRVTQIGVEWKLHLFAVTLRRKFMAMDKIDAQAVVDAAGDDTTCWQLELHSASTMIRFGVEPVPANLKRLGALIGQRRAK